MPFFKYCDADVVDRVGGGSLRFSSLAWFRHLEEDQGDTVIGDRVEGRAETHIDYMHSDGRLSDADSAAAARTGISIGGATGVTISNHTYVQDAGHWSVFCFSASSDLDLSGSGYSASVEISDVEALKDCIVETGVVGNVRIREVFDGSLHGRVRYFPRSADAREVRQALAGDPMVKRERYSTQNEYRIALHARDEWLPDIQYVQITPPPGLLNVAVRGVTTGLATPPSPTRTQVATELLVLIERIEAADHDARSREIGLFTSQTLTNDERIRFIDEITQSASQDREAFKAQFGPAIAAACWRARMLGVRGEWERQLEPGWLSAHAVPGELARIVYELESTRTPAHYLNYVRSSPARAAHPPPFQHTPTISPASLNSLPRLPVYVRQVRMTAGHRERGIAETKVYIAEIERGERSAPPGGVDQVRRYLSAVEGELADLQRWLSQG